jgi:hypothetical protein
MYCGIFIIVLWTILGFILFAEETKKTFTVNSLLDTKEDLERRENDNKIPLNLVFQMHPAGSGFVPFLIDRNDSTAIRLMRLFPNRAVSFRVMNGRMGLMCRESFDPNSLVGLNNQGLLLINANNYSLDSVEQQRAILSRGLPIQKTPHFRRPNVMTVLTVYPDFNFNPNNNNNNPNPNPNPNTNTNP